MTVTIHPSSVVHPEAQIGEGTTIGPFCYIGPRVVLGKENNLHSHVVIDGITSIGDNNKIFPFASIGTQPQDLKYNGEESTLHIGHKNLIREYVTIQPGTKGGLMKTVIGNGNLLMANSHVGHDGTLGDGNVVANSVALAGHVTIGNKVTLGGLAAVHQFVRIGDYALLAGGATVVNDVPPCFIVQGDRASVAGINKIRLEREGYSKEEIAVVLKFYKEIFFSKGVFKEKIQNASEEYLNNSLCASIVSFCQESQRGIAPIRRNSRD